MRESDAAADIFTSFPKTRAGFTFKEPPWTRGSGINCLSVLLRPPGRTCSLAATRSVLSALGLADVRVDYIIVDTIRVPRDLFAAIIEAWRDGYSGPIGEPTPVSRESAVQYFDQMIANIRDPQAYTVWMIPVVSTRVP